ncbi:MAG: DUF3179 domain-containing protein, partial [Anaerolineae bacterium]|nr:DUF3179 domain-containing protein [Anaerolineae bacterium]
LGVGIVGTYAGTQLNVLPAQVVSFGQFAAQYPDGEVLAPGGRSYGSNPYVGYDSSADPFLFLGEPDDRLFPTARVLAGYFGGDPMAYPFEVLAEVGVVNDMVGGQDVVVFYTPGQTSALDEANIDASRDVGTATLFSRTLDGETLTFTQDDTGNFIDEQTGSVWNVFGTAVTGELAGAQLRPLLAAPHFWFAWAAFAPETGIYGVEP